MKNKKIEITIQSIENRGGVKGLPSKNLPSSCCCCCCCKTDLDS